MLSWRNLVMLRFCQNTQLPKFLVQLFHVSGYPRLDRAEIVIVHLLPFRRLCPEKRAARVSQIGAHIVHFFGYQKIFLLGPDIRAHAFCGLVAEQPKNTKRLLIKRLHRAQQRRFFIKRMSAV